MNTPPRLDTAERRRRLAVRHRLAVPAATVEEAVDAVAGLHSSDPASVFLSARSRVAGFRVEHLEDALYERKSLVRMLGMRRTMFVVSPEMAAEMDAACTKSLAPRERSRLETMLVEQGVATDGGSWLAETERQTLEALERLGEATATELTEVVPALGTRLTFGAGKTWQGEMGVSTRVLFLLATDGRILRGRPRGSWRSSQYRWAPVKRWLGRELDALEPDEAQRRLADRWLRAYGPGTETDLKWWTGWSLGRTRAALASAGAVEVELDDGVGYVAAGDVAPTEEPESWVALLPGLDSSVMGWKQREWFLGPHGTELFDRNGNAGPTVWWNGRIVGGWAHRDDGRIAVHLLEEVPDEATEAVEAEAERLGAWLGDVRVVPRFRVPLDKRLTD